MTLFSKLRFLNIVVTCGLFTGLPLASNATINKYIEKNDSFSKTSTTSTSTFSQNIPIVSFFTSIPEFTMYGDAYAYEEGRDFVTPPAPKIIELGTLTTSYGSVTESDDTGLIVQKYGDPQVTDTARAQASFSGTPIGPQISAGPATTSALDGIIGNLGLTLDVTQEGALESTISYAKGIVDDPFYYSGLTDEQTIWLTPSLDSGTRFTYDTGGFAAADMFSSYRGAINTSAGTIDLFNLNIGIGNDADFNPDIVVDFSSNALFGIDDNTKALTILDAFSFDSFTKSFFLEDTLDLFTLPINIPTLGEALENPFVMSLTSEGDTGGDPFQLITDFTPRYTYDGSGLARISNNNSSTPGYSVPEPNAALMLLFGFLLMVFRLRSSKQQSRSGIQDR